MSPGRFGRDSCIWAGFSLCGDRLVRLPGGTIRSGSRPATHPTSEPGPRKLRRFLMPPPTRIVHETRLGCGSAVPAGTTGECDGSQPSRPPAGQIDYRTDSMISGLTICYACFEPCGHSRSQSREDVHASDAVSARRGLGKTNGQPGKPRVSLHKSRSSSDRPDDLRKPRASRGRRFRSGRSRRQALPLFAVHPPGSHEIGLLISSKGLPQAKSAATGRYRRPVSGASIFSILLAVSS